MKSIVLFSALIGVAGCDETTTARTLKDSSIVVFGEPSRPASPQDADLVAHDPYRHPFPPLDVPHAFDLEDEGDPSAACSIRHDKEVCSKICDHFSIKCHHHVAGEWDCTTCTSAGCVTTVDHTGCPF